LFKEASNALKNLIGSDPVELRFQSGKLTRDRYGRILATLFSPDGRNLHEAMIRGGWSGYYTKFGRSPNYDGTYQAAELDARKSDRGIWKSR
jgi:endonuclease YncB( thermonuclease family)